MGYDERTISYAKQRHANVVKSQEVSTNLGTAMVR
jgi:hypothetical protein